MATKKIKAKELAEDIRAGLSSQALKEKYQIIGFDPEFIQVF